MTRTTASAQTRQAILQVLWLTRRLDLATTIRRRTRVARLFPNEASCLRLVSAVLMEIAEDWQNAEKRYVTFSDGENAVEG